MSLTYSLGNALSGLAAVSRQTEVISSNISNALTEGYARREVALSASSIGGRGAGVTVDGVTRAVNAAITADRRAAQTHMSGALALSDGLARLEVAMGSAANAGSIAGRIGALEQALVAAAAEPSSDAGLQAAQQALQAVVSTLNASAAKVQQMRVDADADIATQIKALNTSLTQIAALNTQISRALTTGADAAGLMDQRAILIDQVASLVPLTEVPRDNGAVALMAPGGVMLVDNSAATFSFTHSHTITADMTLENGLLSGVLVDGRPLDASGGMGKLAGGTLGAAFALRDTVLTAAQSGLDEVAADLALKFQDSANDPSIAGGLGLFTDSGGLVDPSDTTGLSARLRLNTLIDAAQGGSAQLLRDGLYGGGTAVGSAVQLNRWSSALGQSSALAAGVLNDIAAARVSSDREASYQSALFNSLYSAEAAQGVDTDREMQKLLLIETSYAANAKVLQAVDGMLQTLLEI